MPCVPNFRLIGRQLTILETVKKVNFLWRHVTKKRDFVRRRQLEVSTTSDSKVMAHYVFFMFRVILTFDLSRSLFMCGVNIDPLVSTKKYWKFSVAQFLWYDCTLQKPMYRLCDLDLWPMKVNYFLWIDYKPISVLYKFEIDTSTNSREIKYLNIEIWV